MKMLVQCGILLTSALCAQAFSVTDCTVTPTNVWNDGYQLNVSVTNNSQTPIDHWTVALNFTEPAQVTGNWNAVITGGTTNTVTASNASWNGTLQPGQSTSFGLHGNHDGSFNVPTCVGDKSSIDIISIAVTNVAGQTPVKGDPIRLTLTVVNNGNESASASLMPKISSSRFSDFSNVNFPSTTVTLAAAEQREITVDAGPFVHDQVTNKHYALGTSDYVINSILVNGAPDTSFSGNTFSISTSNAVLVPVLYDQAYLDSVNYPGSIENYLSSAFTRDSEVFSAQNTYQFFDEGFDQILGIKHIFYALPGFSAGNHTGFCEQATAAAKTMLGLAQDWVGPVSTNIENHGFDYLIGLTPEIGGGATCGWLGVQVSGIFEVGQPIDLTQAIFVHEVGHVFGADHCDPFQGYVMCGGEHHPHYIESGIFVWHYTSLEQMSNRFD